MLVSRRVIKHSLKTSNSHLCHQAWEKKLPTSILHATLLFLGEYSVSHISIIYLLYMYVYILYIYILYIYKYIYIYIVHTSSPKRVLFPFHSLNAITSGPLCPNAQEKGSRYLWSGEGRCYPNGGLDTNEAPNDKLGNMNIPRSSQWWDLFLLHFFWWHIHEWSYPLSFLDFTHHQPLPVSCMAYGLWNGR